MTSTSQRPLPNVAKVFVSACVAVAKPRTNTLSSTVPDVPIVGVGTSSTMVPDVETVAVHYSRHPLCVSCHRRRHSVSLTLVLHLDRKTAKLTSAHQALSPWATPHRARDRDRHHVDRNGAESWL
jgi:hypothetical protein